jgi:hypothetical protein
MTIQHSIFRKRSLVVVMWSAADVVAICCKKAGVADAASGASEGDSGISGDASSIAVVAAIAVAAALLFLLLPLSFGSVMLVLVLLLGPMLPPLVPAAAVGAAAFCRSFDEDRVPIQIVYCSTLPLVAALAAGAAVSYTYYTGDILL